MTALNREEWLATCADLAETYERGWEEAADKLMRDGAEQERTAIVAWLRNFWDGADDEDFKCAADAIAAGEHHGKETT